MRVTAASEPGLVDRSNEDWFSASPGLIVVLDGATARTETGCRHGVSWYAAQLGAAVSAQATSRETPLRDALAWAIDTVARKHPECDLDNPGTPSAAVAILRVFEPETVEYLALGDISIVIDAVGGLRIVTDDRVDKTATSERRLVDQYPIGSPEKQEALIRMKYAELAARNRPGGFWVAATDPGVVEEAIIGTLPLAAVRRCAVLTDGAARLVRLFETMTWPQLLHLLDDVGPGELLRRVRGIEEQDPVGLRWPRNKQSDDATIVYIRRVGPDPRSGSPVPL
jgi:hypothetical protein